jgi:ketosteroid isomerase-like protein
MSRENVELARRTYAAFAEQGGEGLLPFADEEIEIDESPEFPDTQRTFWGHDGVRKLVGLFTDSFDDFRMEPEDFIEGTEDRVVVVVKVIGTAKASRVPVEDRSFHVHTVKHGKSVRMRIFLNRDAALEAAGLRE